MCMEEQKSTAPKKINQSETLSFLESIMAGGCFCVDLDAKTITFKHYKKDKEYTRTFDLLPALDQNLYTLPSEKILKYFQTEYKILPNIKHFLIKKQLKRFHNYTHDPLYRATPSETSLSSQTVQDADKSNPLEEPNSTIIASAEQYKNRFALEEALHKRDPEKFRQACWKTTWINYEPLRNLAHHREYLPPHFKKIGKKYISLFDTLFSGGEFEIIENKLEFKHFKKNKNHAAVVGIKNECLFNTNYFTSLFHLLTKIDENKKYNDYLLLLSVLTPHQKKAIIFYREVLLMNERGPLQGNDRKTLLEKLYGMDLYEKKQLNGFDMTRHSDSSYHQWYIDQFLEVRKNTEAFNLI